VAQLSALTSSAAGTEDGLTAASSLDLAEGPSTEGPEIAPAASRSSPAPARYFTINQVLAKQRGTSSSSSLTQLAAVQPSASTVDAPATASAVRQSDEPFGLLTLRAPEGQLWRKWREVSAAFRLELRQVSACRESEDSCTAPAKRFASLVDSAKRVSGRQRYQLVNRTINAAVRYVSDYTNHGVADKWSAPLATLSSGRGDCEDYAIAKFMVLLEAGTPKRDLRLVLAHDRLSRQHHAVLAVRDDGRWLILDNRWSELRSDSGSEFVPLFAIASEEVRLFAAPYSMRVIDARGVSPASSLY